MFSRVWFVDVENKIGCLSIQSVQAFISKRKTFSRAGERVLLKMVPCCEVTRPCKLLFFYFVPRLDSFFSTMLVSLSHALDNVFLLDMNA